MIRLDTQILLEDHEGYCALHHAIQAGDNNVLRELLKSKELQDTPKGIDTGDRQGATALHHAAKAGKVKLAKKLIEAHATINITNNHDRSVLYMALKENEDEMVEFLLEKGAEDRNLPAELVKRLEEIKATIKWHQVTKEKAARKMRGNSLKVSVGGWFWTHAGCPRWLPSFSRERSMINPLRHMMYFMQGSVASRSSQNFYRACGTDGC